MFAAYRIYSKLSPCTYYDKKQEYHNKKTLGKQLNFGNKCILLFSSVHGIYGSMIFGL